MATLRATNRENRKVQLELPAVTRWAGTLHVNTSWANEHDDTNRVHCTCQHHQGTVHMTTTPWNTAQDNTNWVHCTGQRQLGRVQISNASVNTAWAYYTCNLGLGKLHV